MIRAALSLRLWSRAPQPPARGSGTRTPWPPPTHRESCRAGSTSSVVLQRHPCIAHNATCLARSALLQARRRPGAPTDSCFHESVDTTPRAITASAAHTSHLIFAGSAEAPCPHLSLPPGALVVLCTVTVMPLLHARSPAAPHTFRASASPVCSPSPWHVPSGRVRWPPQLGQSGSSDMLQIFHAKIKDLLVHKSCSTKCRNRDSSLEPPVYHFDGAITAPFHIRVGDLQVCQAGYAGAQPLRPHAWRHSQVECGRQDDNVLPNKHTPGLVSQRRLAQQAHSWTCVSRMDTARPPPHQSTLHNLDFSHLRAHAAMAHHQDPTPLCEAILGINIHTHFSLFVFLFVLYTYISMWFATLKSRCVGSWSSVFMMCLLLSFTEHKAFAKTSKKICKS